jgi:hypothetical protein
MYVQPRKRGGLGRLRGILPGSMSIPVYSFVSGAPAFPKPVRGCKCRGLGDDSGIDPATGLSYQYEQVFGTSNPAAGGNAPIGIDPATGLSYQYEQVFGTSNPARGGNAPLPNYISPSTYASAIPAAVPSPSGGFNTQGLTNPFAYSSALSPAGAAPASTIGGLSTTTLLLGGAALLAVVLLAGRRR